MIQAIETAAAFLDSIAPLTIADPEGLQLIGIVARVTTGNHHFVSVDATTGEVRACALVTSRGLIMSPTMEATDARALGLLVASTVPGLIPEARGPKASLPAFLDGYTSKHVTAKVTPHHHLLLYVLNPAALPTNVNAIGGRTVVGAAALATTEHKPLLLAFMARFYDEVGEPSTPAAIEASLDAQMARQGMYVWLVDGSVVACAGHSAPVPAPDGSFALYRIMTVFTPEAHRGNGYASALTASICHNLLALRDGPPSRLMLFADATVAAANKAYQRIGFVQKSEMITARVESTES
ncbi:hypothetical protein SDRG_16390 [Saprolegnia diclina VS20]|uniref:N-acetyltransferase domain-containing protein n=1 Tax=Saprolegnia diclina (strain VS20) TaxID=1156394 RepID=T0R151_SAPDV|nr:hypothetical protein SDRG_16390 [Saprolegnia diclina VS20]EQC25728.1 hypothetical protein SDRG_16390 [Saprolegnia diclina VS20]|eukprot:XP_008620820.1 hypothetical protein SDRG_16390 [Saprolegnia diclina VS20]